MNVSDAGRLLARAARPLTLSVARRVPGHARAQAGGSFDSDLCDEMYAFSARLMSEDRGHWQHHVDTNDCAHVLRDAKTNDLLGFQLWR